MSVEDISFYQRDLEAAHSTISEQEKRIAGLEAERDEARNRNASVELEAVGYSNRMHDAIAKAEEAEQALTSERHRRKAADKIIGLINPNLRLPESVAAQAYLRKYEPIPADREEERGG